MNTPPIDIRGEAEARRGRWPWWARLLIMTASALLALGVAWYAAHVAMNSGGNVVRGAIAPPANP